MDYLWKVSSKAKELLSQTSDVSENVAQKDQSSDSPGDKPVSSLSLETERGNSDREASPESEGIESEQNLTSPLIKDSDSTVEGAAAEPSDPSSSKLGISAGDLKDVSQKAVESAKSIKSYIFGIANKTTKTISETAKQLKTTVEENSIIGDFNKEQEAFVTSKNSNDKNECPAPWIGAEDEESLKQQILSLSSDRRNFLRSPPTGVLFDFNFDSMYPVAKTMLNEDPALEKMRFEIVPKLINEENFWRNYFYRVQLVKNSSRLSKTANKKGDNSSSSENSSPNESTKAEDDWEKEMQQELQEYEVVNEGNDDDPDWENEIEQMLDTKVKNIV